MKKEIWILIFLAVIIVVLLAFFVFMPAPARNNPPKPTPTPVAQSGIVIISPKINDEVSSPLKITGIVNGDGWAGFEGQVGNVVLTFTKNSDLNQPVSVGPVPLTATTEWTKLPTNFEATVTFVPAMFSDYDHAVLVFHNENPSGDPAKDKTFSLSVIIK